MISIIIPVLNEEIYIGKLLNHLLANASAKNISEIIIVDGGSLDSTKTVARDFINVYGFSTKEAYFYTEEVVINATSFFTETKKPKIELLNSNKGRAKQMNLGAKYATGDILYFLHVDSFPPKNFDQLIINEFEKGNDAGCFRMQFDSKHLWLRLASWFTQFSWRACRGGDQSQFITKTLFNSIGGFDEDYIIYEDNILINELYNRNKFVVINEKLKSSARMYRKHGVWKLQYLYWSIYLKKWFGADCNTLHTYYKKYIA